MVSKADVMLLEARLRSLAPRMSVKLLCHQGINTPYDNPVQVTWGSNSFNVDRDSLEPLLDLLDTEERISPYSFLRDYWEPFLRTHVSQ